MQTQENDLALIFLGDIMFRDSALNAEPSTIQVSSPSSSPIDKFINTLTAHQLLGEDFFERLGPADWKKNNSYCHTTTVRVKGSYFTCEITGPAEIAYSLRNHNWIISMTPIMITLPPYQAKEATDPKKEITQKKMPCFFVYETKDMLWAEDELAEIEKKIRSYCTIIKPEFRQNPVTNKRVINTYVLCRVITGQNRPV